MGSCIMHKWMLVTVSFLFWIVAQGVAGKETDRFESSNSNGSFIMLWLHSTHKDGFEDNCAFTSKGNLIWMTTP